MKGNVYRLSWSSRTDEVKGNVYTHTMHYFRLHQRQERLMEKRKPGTGAGAGRAGKKKSNPSSDRYQQQQEDEQDMVSVQSLQADVEQQQRT